MGQITSGLRALLSSALVYDLFQNAAGAGKQRREIARYLRAWPGARMLDIGCGTAEILDYLPAVEYHGFDASHNYIDSAKTRYGGRGNFSCDTVTSKALVGLPPFDIALASGVLHHLGDDEVRQLLALARSILKGGGRLLTIDPCFSDNQSRIARLIISWDRGQNVRRQTEYECLARSVFNEVVPSLRHDLLNIPYTNLIMECRA